MFLESFAYLCQTVLIFSFLIPRSIPGASKLRSQTADGQNIEMGMQCFSAPNLEARTGQPPGAVNLCGENWKEIIKISKSVYVGFLLIFQNIL